MLNVTSVDPLMGVNTLHYAWGEASLEGKVIVGLLFVFSLIAWTIMVAKLFQLRKSLQLNRMFWTSFRKQSEPLAIYDQHLTVEGCPNFNVYMAATEEFSRSIGRNESKEQTYPYSDVSQQCLERSLESSVAVEAEKLESGMVILAMAVSGAPFIGLLGTVWGVMTIFSDVAMDGQAQLVNMAPGLSAAMMTTVAGLLVAIPSMFGYNCLISMSRSMVVDLDNFAQALSVSVLTKYSIPGAAKTTEETQNELPLEKP